MSDFIKKLIDLGDCDEKHKKKSKKHCKKNSKKCCKKGQTGATGQQGPTGSTGQQGPTGPTGQYGSSTFSWNIITGNVSIPNSSTLQFNGDYGLILSNEKFSLVDNGLFIQFKAGDLGFPITSADYFEYGLSSDGVNPLYYFKVQGSGSGSSIQIYFYANGTLITNTQYFTNNIYSIYSDGTSIYANVNGYPFGEPVLLNVTDPVSLYLRTNRPLETILNDIFFYPTGKTGSPGTNGIDGATTLRYILESVSGGPPSGSTYFTTAPNINLSNTTTFEFAYNSLTVPSEGFWNTVSTALINSQTVFIQVVQTDNTNIIGLYQVLNVVYSGLNGGIYQVSCRGDPQYAIYGIGIWTEGKTYAVSFNLGGVSGQTGTTGPTGPNPVLSTISGATFTYDPINPPEYIQTGYNTTNDLNIGNFVTLTSSDDNVLFGVIGSTGYNPPNFRIYDLRVVSGYTGTTSRAGGIINLSGPYGPTGNPGTFPYSTGTLTLSSSGGDIVATVGPIIDSNVVTTTKIFLTQTGPKGNFYDYWVPVVNDGGFYVSGLASGSGGSISFNYLAIN